MELTKRLFGIYPGGKEAWLYTLQAGELTLELTDAGAAWVSLIVPSERYGKEDILLGHPSFKAYVNNTCFFGATVGRFANRISGAAFSLEGKEYHISENKPGCSLHGGEQGFSKRLWRAKPYKDGDGVYVRFELESPDGDQGYPGNLKAAVTYGITEKNELAADYRADVDALCPVNLTNHAYFNLGGAGSGRNVLSNELMLYSSSYINIDENLIPTGELADTKNTPFDFSRPKSLGQDLPQIRENGGDGYDHCFVIDGEAGKLRPFCELYDPVSGRKMKGYTTQPGVQVYTGNMLKAVPGKRGTVYHKYGGICLETEYFPDSPNRKEFPCSVFGPKRPYREKTVFTFEW